MTRLLPLLLLPLAALAQPGTLDPSFGSGGTVFLTPDPVAGASAVVLTADGKLVLAGRVGGDAALLRLNTDGSLDSSFGEEGYARLDFGGEEEQQFAGLVVRADGSVVASGLALDGEGDGINVLAAFTPDGVLDPSFGDAGTVSVSEGFERLEFLRLAERPDGRLIVTGTGFASGASQTAAIVAQFSADGALDSSFGTDGIAQLTSPGSLSLVGQDLALEDDGDIVVGGFASSGTFSVEPFAARLTAEGALDASFGVRTFDFGEDFSLASGVIVDEAGRAVLVGSAVDLFAGASSLVLARLNADTGTLDSSFGEGGLVFTTLGTNIAQGVDVTELEDGALLTAGPAGPDGLSADLTVARFLPDGALDASFGTNGVAAADVRPVDVAGALAVEPDGDIVVVGYEATGVGGFAGIEAARFTAPPVSAEPTGEALSAFRLGAPYPNPARDVARLPVSAPQGASVRVEAFDRLGRRVAVLHDGPLASGVHVEFDLGRLASGAYAVRAVSAGRSVTRWVVRP